MKKRTSLLLIPLFFCVVAFGGGSRAGKQWLGRFSSLLGTGSLRPPFPSPAWRPGPEVEQDVEQTARAQHGWSSALINSVISGEIYYYDEDGKQAASGAITIYRKFPNGLKAVINWGNSTEVNGVDEAGAWVQGQDILSKEDARDIQAFLYIWPDRLFTSRDAGALYREVGTHVKDYHPAIPGRPRLDLDSPVTFHQVEMEDAGKIEKSAARKIYYSIRTDNSRVSALRYLEPDDPSADLLDAEAERTEIRVEFANWQTINQVLWPFEITHWSGGKVDFLIKVADISMNRYLPDSIFQRP